MLNESNLYPYQNKISLHQCTCPSTMIWAEMGLGKEQPNSEPVLTPGGWLMMGEIKPGMWVIGADGNPAKVGSVHPQGVKEIVTINFNDGSSTRCGWEHLWKVGSGSRGKQEVLTTREIFNKGLYSGKAKNLKWSIPMCKPVEYHHRNLPINPYILGVILGDGYSSERGGVRICTDIETLKKCKASSIKPHETSKYTGYGYIAGMKQHLRNMNLMGKRSWEKHVPEIYMRSPVRYRLMLLQGLLDTDGSPIGKGGVEFSSTSEMLTNAVVELVQSLGGVARKKGPRVTQHQNGDGRPSWRVNVKLPSQLTPFTLQRKLDKWVRPTKYQPNRRIKSIVVTGEEESTCIYVLNEDHLYLTRNHIVTHNTVATLTSVNMLLQSGWLRGVLIVAPIRVCRLVWRKEATKWAHLNHLTFSMVVGTADQRLRALMDPNKDVYLINYENLQWLSTVLQDYFINRSRQIPFDGLVWDEISKMKNSTSKRAKAFKKVIHHFKWRTGLTGTPASNGFKDLHGQYLVIDDGARLGEFKTKFMTRYYWKEGFKTISFPNTENEIKERISDITLEMSAADYNPLPDMIVNDIEIELQGKFKEDYDRLEREFFLQLDSGKEIELFNKGSLLNKLLQYSNGAVYVNPGEPDYEIVHDMKLDALESIIDEANGQPVLCAYAYKSDAERIMKKFKKLKPINLTKCKSEKALKMAMDRWQNGECPLMIGHPACLSERTEVLTERNGWVKIVDVGVNDRVFDGIEFVEHDGCSYSGCKEVIDLFGITMTPNHKLLINNEWVEARNVTDIEKSRNEAIFKWEEVEHCSSEMSQVRSDFGNDDAERKEAQRSRKTVLSALYQGNIPQYDQHSNMENMAGNQESVKKYGRQELCRKRYRSVQRMGRFSKVLRRYVRELSGRFNNRKGRCEQRLFQKQLCVDNQHGSTRKQKEQSKSNISRCGNAPSRIGKTIRLQQNDVIGETKQRYDCRSGSRVMQKLPIWEESEASKCSEKRKEKVYDLVNCGPRHRFLIRNNDGEMFISHNSMGHGIDGLQDSGNILVWYGLTWSLDLQDQFNARVRRQGQGKPVICHRIWCPSTAEALQDIALRDKSLTEESLKRAVKEYRVRKCLTSNPS